MKKFSVSLILALSTLLVTVALLTGTNSEPQLAHAAGPHYVANTCTGVPLPCYSIIQAAIDAATNGDVIKVAAGTYTNVNHYGGQTQLAYISKTVTIRGGYAIDFSEPPDPDANPTILDAKGQGRGLYITGEISPTIEGLQITGGNAFNGGGVYIITATAHLVKIRVYSNTATFLGGGLYSIGAPTIERSSITGNTAESGGAGGVLLAGGGGAAQALGAAKFSANVVSHNTACYAGGVDLVLSTALLTANTIHNNTAKTCGSISDSGIGGGLLIDQESNAMLINNLIFDNQADASGSGLYISGSSPRLLHSTIASNSGGDGSGIYVVDRFGIFSSLSLTNTILVSHTIGITVAANNTATLESTLWFDNVADWDGAGTIITGTRNYAGLPAFVNPDQGNYHLSMGSAAIDKGVDAGVTMDIDGDSRDSEPDLGVDEVVFSSFYLPLILKN
jgi:hypothetical protein